MRLPLVPHRGGVCLWQRSAELVQQGCLARPWVVVVWWKAMLGSSEAMWHSPAAIITIIRPLHAPLGPPTVNGPSRWLGEDPETQGMH